MPAAPDPFRVLSLAYDADLEDVRRAFRRVARTTHPDRGGSATEFHRARVAYDALAADLEAERRRWRPLPPGRRFAAGLDPRLFPTCPVRISRARDGRRRFDYVLEARPADWRPGADRPPGERKVRIEATASFPAFGVWVVRVTPSTFRCVFGP